MHPFVVTLSGLAYGKTRFEWRSGAEFFEYFENDEILAADIEVSAMLNNHGVTVDVACEIKGSVTVSCDRCLEDLEIGVECSFEETCTPDSEELDLRQDIYDYILTSLPLQRVHPDGDCNSETTKYLSK